MPKTKAKVGDYVKIIKKPPYKEYDVDVGDIGIVNYVTKTTGKYSVHIDGKKNPHDIENPNLRAYGVIYDFWIPFDCTEIIDAQIVSKSNNNDMNESEDIKMKEIKNQEVVDLYFSRKDKILKEKYEARKKEIISKDKHQEFIKKLKDQFDIYVNDSMELCYVSAASYTSNVSFNVTLPYTEETLNELEKLEAESNDEHKELNILKEEVLAMLSGCDKYDQEMAVLNAYDIVSYDERESHAKMISKTN